MVSFAFDIIFRPAMLIVSIIVGSNKGISVLRLESSNMSYNFLIMVTELVFKIYSSADKIVFNNHMNIVRPTSIGMRRTMQLYTFAAVWFPTKL